MRFVPSNSMCWFVPRKGFIKVTMMSQLVPKFFRTSERSLLVSLRLGYNSESSWFGIGFLCV
jgi:hypothetical protein